MVIANRDMGSTAVLRVCALETQARAERCRRPWFAMFFVLFFGVFFWPYRFLFGFSFSWPYCFCFFVFLALVRRPTVYFLGKFGYYPSMEALEVKVDC